VGKTGLEQAKKLLISYKTGETKEMTPQLWRAKKIIDSTLHPGKAYMVLITTYTRAYRKFGHRYRRTGLPAV